MDLVVNFMDEKVHVMHLKKFCQKFVYINKCIQIKVGYVDYLINPG